MRGSIVEDPLLKDRPEIKKHAVENILCRRSFSYGDGFFHPQLSTWVCLGILLLLDLLPKVVLEVNA
ncbi:MAG: hypothetical protein DRN19_05245 [Thermoplasmata archaeon]|nr:MAG: hypothetical protein DRN19_05245 [Thermoplasmata archaeon]